MSLFASFKKALGFPEEYEDLDDLSDLEDTDEAEVPSALTDEATVSEETDGGDKELTALTDSIMACFRQNTQDGGSENTARQEITGLLEKALTEMAVDVRSRLEHGWQQEKADYHREISGFKKSAVDFDSQRRKFESDRLSSDRQKRALNDRIADMENRIRDMEAEREQLLLENQCMVNKLRGATMTVGKIAGGDNAGKQREENEQLRRELNNVKRQLAFSEKRLKELEEDERPSFEELKAVEDQIKKFEAVKESKDAEIKRLTNRLDLAEASNTELGERIAKSAAQIEEQEATIKTLNHTIETNLTDHALSEAGLQKEISRLKEMLDNSQQPREMKKRGRKKKDNSQEDSPKQTVKISAIDELMDNTDWFSAPEPGPRIKDPEVIENFGYKEQPKKPSKKYDENQLTLF